MSEEKTGLKNCPFCESDNLQIELSPTGYWHVFCKECLGRSGECISEGQSRVLWNMRAYE